MSSSCFSALHGVNPNLKRRIAKKNKKKNNMKITIVSVSRGTVQKLDNQNFIFEYISFEHMLIQI